MLLGYRFESVAANAVFGPIFGLFLFIYVVGIWKLKRWVLPLAVFYAFYVPVNLVLFWFTHGAGQHPTIAFQVVYLAFALTGSVGTAIYLAYHHTRLS